MTISLMFDLVVLLLYLKPCILSNPKKNSSRRQYIIDAYKRHFSLAQSWASPIYVIPRFPPRSSAVRHLIIIIAKPSQRRRRIPTPKAKRVTMAAPWMLGLLALPMKSCRAGVVATVDDAVGTGMVVLAKPTPFGPKLTI